MRLHRSIGTALAVLLAACQHDEVTELIGRDNTTTIPAIDLTTGAAGGFLSGTRVHNRFLASGTFDTPTLGSFVANAYGAASAPPPVSAL